MADQEWKEAEIRRDDLKRLLENTKKLAQMYSDLMGVKKQGWENVLKSQVKRAAKEKDNG